MEQAQIVLSTILIKGENKELHLINFQMEQVQIVLSAILIKGGKYRITFDQLPNGAGTIKTRM